MTSINGRFAISIVLALQIGGSVHGQRQGTFVSGLAVYHDAESDEVKRAGGVDLILISGAYQGPIEAPPPTARLDSDTTAHRFNNYRLEDEGIFQLYAPDPVQVVSIAYLLATPDQSDPAALHFFSTTLYPRLRPQKDRLIAKLQLELWPTDRPVNEAVVMRNLLTGILITHIAVQRIEDKSDEATKDAILIELKTLVDLLPEDREKRFTMIREALERLPALLPKGEFPTPKIIEWLPPLDEPFWNPTGERFRAEKERWNRVRNRLKP